MVAIRRLEELDPPLPDDLPTKAIKPHTLQKLYYVARLVQPLSTATKNVFSGNRVYLDLFAAHGVCADSGGGRHWGSALLALQALDPFDVYIFNDIDPVAAETLARRASALGVTGAQIFELDLCDTAVLARARDLRDVFTIGPKVIVLRGDANTAPLVIKHLLPESRWRYLFAVIDPPSTLLHWSTLEALAYHEKAMDTLMLFPDEMEIGRWLKYRLEPGHGEKWNRFFGPLDWKAVAQGDPAHAPRALREAYEFQVRSLGFRTGRAKTVANVEKNRALYRLIFASRKEEPAIRIWNQSSRPTPSGQDELPLDYA